MEGDLLCPICRLSSHSEIVEPINTNCGHLFCWPCIYLCVKETMSTSCPTCRTDVKKVFALYGIGMGRDDRHSQVPPRPPTDVDDPFEEFREVTVRRSRRPRTANSRLIDYDVFGLTTASAASVYVGGSGINRSFDATERLGMDENNTYSGSDENTTEPITGEDDRRLDIDEIESGSGSAHSRVLGTDETTRSAGAVENNMGFGTDENDRRSGEVQNNNGSGIGETDRSDENRQGSGLGTYENRGLEGAAASSSTSPLGEDEVDFSDDEDQARREFEAENAEHLRSVVPRFKIKDNVPGTAGLNHLDIVISEVKEQVLTHQIKINGVNWMEVARSIRRNFPLSFPGAGEQHLKEVKSVSRICRNALKKAVTNYKAKRVILSRTGNTGPPETESERALGIIISVDNSTSATNRETSSSRRGRPGRPMILDPQPISRSANRSPSTDLSTLTNRSHMTDRERSESSAALNLDTPVRDSTYRQDRTTLARQGAELRESSLAEMHQRRNATPRAPRTAVAVSSITSNLSNAVEEVSSRKSNVEALILQSWQVREQDRERDREERRRREVMEKEDRDRKEKIEKEERERRDTREERRLAMEREDKEKTNFFMLRLLGQTQILEKREIKVKAYSEGSDSQPFSTKLRLSSLAALKKDLCDYMGETVIDGVVLQEASGESLIMTNTEQFEEAGNSRSFVVKKLIKRGKSYFLLTTQ